MALGFLIRQHRLAGDVSKQKLSCKLLLISLLLLNFRYDRILGLQFLCILDKRNDSYLRASKSDFGRFSIFGFRILKPSLVLLTRRHFQGDDAPFAVSAWGYYLLCHSLIS